MINKQVFTQAKALLSMIVRVSPLITIFRSVETVVTAMAVFVAIISVFATVPVLVVVKTMFVTITVFVVRVTVFMIVITGFVSVPRIVPLRIFRPLSLMTTVGLKKFIFFFTFFTLPASISASKSSPADLFLGSTVTFLSKADLSPLKDLISEPFINSSTTFDPLLPSQVTDLPIVLSSGLASHFLTGAVGLDEDSLTVLLYSGLLDLFFLDPISSNLSRLSLVFSTQPSVSELSSSFFLCFFFFFLCFLVW